MRRKKRTPFGNHPVTVLCWWVFNALWFAACGLATVWLVRLLVALLWLSLIQGVGAPW